MEYNTILSKKSKIYKLLQEKSLAIVFYELRGLIAESRLPELITKLEAEETNYKYMIKYMLDGVEDSMQGEVYKNILLSLYTIADRVFDALMLQSASGLYYDKRRYHNTLPHSIIEATYNSLQKSEDIASISNSTDSVKGVEDIQNRLFLHLMANYNTSDVDYTYIERIILGNEVSDTTKALAISALHIGLLYNFDERKLANIIDSYTASTSEDVKQRALCAILTISYIYRDRVALYSNISSRLKVLSDNATFCSDARSQYLQLIRSMETERIANILKEEIIPEMMKLSPEIKRRLADKDSATELDFAELNPEWESLLDSNGVTKKIKELNDLQLEGADVLMSTFSALKSYPFFSEPANWLRPFAADNSAFKGLNSNEKGFISNLNGANLLCNSDKYSLALTISSMPANSGDMLMSQLPIDKEMMNIESGNKEVESSLISNQYIQDLYRFFKVSPNKISEHNIFDMDIDIFKVKEFDTIFNSEDNLRMVGEFYFKKRFYPNATNCFEQLLTVTPNDATTIQKLGYCKEMQHNYDGAIANYCKSDMIESKFWTLNRIAICYKHLNSIDLAIKYFNEAANRNPESLSTALQLGNCYLSVGDFNEALKHYFKVDYLSNGDSKAWRGVAWCSFVSGNITQAIKYYNKILELDSASANDMFNAAHSYLVAKDRLRAITLYRESIKLRKDGFDSFIKSMQHDRDMIIANGVSSSEIDLVLDKLRFDVGEGD